MMYHDQIFARGRNLIKARYGRDKKTAVKCPYEKRRGDEDWAWVYMKIVAKLIYGGAEEIQNLSMFSFQIRAKINFRWSSLINSGCGDD